VRHYGDALSIYEITRLDPAGFKERIHHQVKADRSGGRVANHHLDWNGGMLVMDAQRLLPSEDAIK
jgi:hypothetical protein